VTFFTTDQFKQQHQLLVSTYDDFIADLRADGPDEEAEGLSQDFLEQFKMVIKSKSLDQYSPLSFYWLNLIDNLVYVLQMWQDGDDEGLTDFWIESEYASAFIEMSKAGTDSLEATSQLMPLLEGQVLGFYHWHLSTKHKAKDVPTLYQLVPDIGDHDMGIRVGHKHQVSPPSPHPDSPALPFWSKDFVDETVNIDDDDGELIGGMQALNSIQLASKEIFIKAATPDVENNIDLHLKNISHALEIIKNASPRCYEAFEIFTESLVLIDEPGIVSYSLQSLPGYSNINVVERDFIDLIDDLIHENGHHALNAVLNYHELIEEDDDKVYWSPWRRALRPIRGMYHGYLTFIWAYLLFSDLSKADIKEFNEEQKDKIKLRFIEEFLMLDFCDLQLDHAYREGKILDAGFELIKSARSLLASERSFVENEIRMLNTKNVDTIQALRGELEKAAQTYLKNL